VGILITPEICALHAPSSPPRFGASAFRSSPSWTGQPTDAMRTTPPGSKPSRYVHAPTGWALSSHSMRTRGHSGLGFGRLAISISIRSIFQRWISPAGVGLRRLGHLKGPS
jgi:hypothetical protein